MNNGDIFDTYQSFLSQVESKYSAQVLRPPHLYYFILFSILPSRNLVTLWTVQNTRWDDKVSLDYYNNITGLIAAMGLV